MYTPSGQATLPDYLCAGLQIVSIGLNPSTVSVQQGVYFANPRNRFWPALDASGLVPVPVTSGCESQTLLLERYGIGFTDVVKRHSSMGSSLRAADYRYGAPILKAKLEYYRPAIAWFHGKMAYRYYLQYGEHRRITIDWGEQPDYIEASRVFVTPNPSPANAAYSLNLLIDWYRALAALRDTRNA